MSDNRQRVVITGLGLVSPIGSDLETVWGNLSSGTSGIAKIDGIPTDSLPVQSGGEVKDFTGAIGDYGELDKKLQRAIKKNMKVMCREIEMGVAASQKALLHSGLGAERDPNRCGCLFGCDYILTRPEEYADGMRNCRETAGGTFQIDDWPTAGLPKVNPLWLLKYLPNMPNSHVSIYNDFRGPNNSLTVREASMNLSVAEATSIIERGAADVMIVGATGSRIHPLRSSHVALIEPLASEKDPPATMASPFDASTDGMVMGEGAGAIVLESEEHARERGAKIWGVIAGHGAAMASQVGSPAAYESAIKRSMVSAVNSAGGLWPEAWHLHAQGLGAPEFDQAESAAINALGDSLKQEVIVTAGKSYFGNLGAGGAAVEMICSLLALEHQQLFSILNLENPMEGIRWRPATAGQSPGSGFLHSSYSMQGQVSCIAVTAA